MLCVYALAGPDGERAVVCKILMMGFEITRAALRAFQPVEANSRSGSRVLHRIDLKRDILSFTQHTYFRPSAVVDAYL